MSTKSFTTDAFRERMAQAIETDLNEAGAQLAFDIKITGWLVPKVTLHALVVDRMGKTIYDLGVADNLTNGCRYALVDLPRMFKVELK